MTKKEIKEANIKKKKIISQERISGGSTGTMGSFPVEALPERLRK